ncbi:MAG: class I SAM-dependent methyltransferase [Candidatus Buchananbacteria bacterium]|nr:class I SAM-dependent methyltransferase [Candidatus Buchananbacteria bacterium]
MKEQLLVSKKIRWLDVGCGDRFEDGFHYLDLFSIHEVPEEFKDRYTQADIAHLSDETVAALGTFDFIRLQHVFEHLSMEEGQRCLENCAKLLNPGGYILITVPDLRVHIQKYLANSYSELKGFSWWAHHRIPKDAPASFYFSIFAHSLPHEAHKWCYDLEGLLYQLKRAKQFVAIRQLAVDDPLSVEPFTHNRIKEDLCVIARKKKPFLKFV